MKHIMPRRTTLTPGNSNALVFALLTQRSRIIKDFYITEPDLAKRPRIFGMTASPVDARQNVVHAAKWVGKKIAVTKIPPNIMQRARNIASLPDCHRVGFVAPPPLNQSSQRKCPEI